MAATEANEKLLQKLRKEHAAAGQATTKQHQAEVQALGRTHSQALQAAVRGQQTEMEQLQRDKVALETRLTSVLSEQQVPDSDVLHIMTLSNVPCFVTRCNMHLCWRCPDSLTNKLEKRLEDLSGHEHLSCAKQCRLFIPGWNFHWKFTGGDIIVDHKTMSNA